MGGEHTAVKAGWAGGGKGMKVGGGRKLCTVGGVEGDVESGSKT